MTSTSWRNNPPRPPRSHIAYRVPPQGHGFLTVRLGGGPAGNPDSLGASLIFTKDAACADLVTHLLQTNAPHDAMASACLTDDGRPGFVRVTPYQYDVGNMVEPGRDAMFYLGEAHTDGTHPTGYIVAEGPYGEVLRFDDLGPGVHEITFPTNASVVPADRKIDSIRARGRRSGWARFATSR